MTPTAITPAGRRISKRKSPGHSTTEGQPRPVRAPTAPRTPRRVSGPSTGRAGTAAPRSKPPPRDRRPPPAIEAPPRSKPPPAIEGRRPAGEGRRPAEAPYPAGAPPFNQASWVDLAPVAAPHVRCGSSGSRRVTARSRPRRRSGAPRPSVARSGCPRPHVDCRSLRHARRHRRDAGRGPEAQQDDGSRDRAGHRPAESQRAAAGECRLAGRRSAHRAPGRGSGHGDAGPRGHRLPERQPGQRPPRRGAYPHS